MIKNIIVLTIMLMFSVGVKALEYKIEGNVFINNAIVESIHRDVGIKGLVDEYKKRGFPTVRVGEKDGEGINLLIEEGNQIKILKVNLKSDIYNSQLFSMVYGRLENKWFVQENVDGVIREIKNYMDENGYLKGAIKVSNSMVSENSIIVNITIKGATQYKIGKIGIEMDGEEDAITDLGLKTGDVADLNLIKKVILKMESGNIYNNADAVMDIEGDIVDIKYVGKKGRSGMIQGGMKYDGVENNVYISIKENNFLGERLIAEGSINYKSERYSVMGKLQYPDGTIVSALSAHAGYKLGESIYENKIKFSKLGMDGKVRWWLSGVDFYANCDDCNYVMVEGGVIAMNNEVVFLDGKWGFKAWASVGRYVTGEENGYLSVGAHVKVAKDIGIVGELQAKTVVEAGEVNGESYNSYMAKNTNVRGYGEMVVLENGRYKSLFGTAQTEKKLKFGNSNFKTGIFVDGSFINSGVASYGAYGSTEFGGAEIEIYYAKKLRGDIEDGVGIKIKNGF